MIARMNLEVVHRHAGQTLRKLGPRCTTIDGRVHRERRPHEQQIAVGRIFANDVQIVCGTGPGQIVHNGLERLAAVLRLEEIRREIVPAMIVERHVERERVKV